MNKPKRGCLSRLLRWAVIGVVALIALGFVAQAVNPAKPTPRPTVVNAINTAQPSATAAPTDEPTTPTITPSPRPTNTSIPSRTPRPSFTPDMTKTLAPTATVVPTSKPLAFSEAAYVKFIQTELDSTNIDVRSVRVADGRANGGVRGVIITYVTVGVREEDFKTEWETLFTRTASALKTNNLDVDEVSIIVGLVNGKASSILVAQIKDLRDFHNNAITRDEFFRRLTVTSF